MSARTIRQTRIRTYTLNIYYVYDACMSLRMLCITFHQKGQFFLNSCCPTISSMSAVTFQFELFFTSHIFCILYFVFCIQTIVKNDVILEPIQGGKTGELFKISSVAWMHR